PTLNQTSSASGISGTWTFGNRQTITFDTMESLNPADLSVTKIGPATATAGGNVTYSITTTNAGPSDAMNVQLNDTPTIGTTIVSFVQNSGPPLGGPLPAGGTQTFTLVLHINSSVPNNF